MHKHLLQTAVIHSIRGFALILVAKAKYPKGKCQPCYAGLVHVTISIQQTLSVSASWLTKPFANVVLSDIEEAAIESSLIDLSNKKNEVY